MAHKLQWFKKEDSVNNLILPIEFNPVSYIGFNQNVQVLQPDFTHWIQPDFTNWIQPDITSWIQQKTVCKIYMYFNQISPTEFNLISPIEFNLISPVGSNQKRFAKSTCISTRFLRWIEPDLKIVCLLGIQAYGFPNAGCFGSIVWVEEISTCYQITNSMVSVRSNERHVFQICLPTTIIITW